MVSVGEKIPVNISLKLTLLENFLASWHEYNPTSSAPTFFTVSSFHRPVSLTSIFHWKLLSTVPRL